MRFSHRRNFNPIHLPFEEYVHASRALPALSGLFPNEFPATPYVAVKRAGRLLGLRSRCPIVVPGTARRDRLRLAAAGRRTRAQRRPHADPATDGAQGQPQARRSCARRPTRASSMQAGLLDSGFSNFLSCRSSITPTTRRARSPPPAIRRKAFAASRWATMRQPLRDGTRLF